MTWDASNPDDREWMRGFIEACPVRLNLTNVAVKLGCLPNVEDVLAALDERDRLEGAR